MSNSRQILTLRITPAEKLILANLAKEQGVTVSEMLLGPYFTTRKFLKKKNA